MICSSLVGSSFKNMIGLVNLTEAHGNISLHGEECDTSSYVVTRVSHSEMGGEKKEEGNSYYDLF